MRLFVGNLHFTVDEARVENFLRAHKITPLSFIILRDAEKRSKCCGFLRISDDEVDKAMKVDGKFLQGQPLKIKREGDRGKQGRTKKL